MKILDVQSYRDGGTIVIETDAGKYWIPPRLTQLREIRKGDNYFDGTTEKVEGVSELFELILSLSRNAEVYHRVKRNFA